ncbi:MAG: isopenicillin N synthase family oxygenase [Hyphomonadaceae bacterium]|nr:isopenicillin N synthase family oxygenase [Hyphomonadaceae bacterium]
MSAVQPISMQLRASDPEGFAKALGASFARYGFAIVSDHGLPPALVDAAWARTKEFFALPEGTKRRYHVPGGKGQRGYTPFGTEAAKGAARVDLKEFWHIGRELPPGHPARAIMPDNLWPNEVESFRRDLYGLFESLDALGSKLLASVARYLDLPGDYFDAAIKDGNSILRLLHYPPPAPGAEGMRAAAHEDINALTLLLGAEEAGLQLLDRDGRWLDVDPPEGAVVVNIGDMLQRLTNHVLPSTSHRVVNPSAARAHLPRYSIPFFLHFAPDFLIDALPSCVSAANPKRYPPITAHDYLEERLREIRLT